MRLVDLADVERLSIAQFGSVGVEIIPLALTETGATAVDIAYVAAGGILGRHAAPIRQLLFVVGGNGWVSGHDDVRRPVSAGQGAVWGAGEEHAAGSESGMTVVIVEAAVPSRRGVLAPPHQ